MLADQITEVIFVGLPGPTHHYGGLAPDNVASNLNRGSVSNPKQAALQVLGLLRELLSLGIAAAVLPPQPRPYLPLLRQHFSGDDETVIRQAALHSQPLLEKASSASAMWTANAATVAPYVDTDGVLHITAANLFSNLHRRIEADETYRILSAIFKDVPNSIVHPPLSAAAGMHDEGAANHMRLSPGMSARGLHVFVYGADGSKRDPASARQTLSASRAIAAQHKIAGSATLFLRQNPEVIEAGVFHNDVIAVSNEYVLLVHERAYEGGRTDIGKIISAYGALHPGTDPVVILVRDDELSVDEAVRTYLFNSQIVTRPDGAMTLIAPAEVELLYEGKAMQLLERIRKNPKNPIDDIRIIDLRQSMRNGGGPACLRLRVPLGSAQLSALSQGARVLASESLLAELTRLIETHYPDELSAADLGNPALYHANQRMMEALTKLLRLSF